MILSIVLPLWPGNRCSHWKSLSSTTPSMCVLAVRHRKTQVGREYHRQLWTQNSPRQLERIHAIHAMSHPQQCPAEGVDGYLADGSETKSPQGHYRSGKKSCRPCPTVLRGNNRSNGRVIKQNTSCTSEEEKQRRFPTNLRSLTPPFSTPEKPGSPLEPAMPSVSASRPPRYRHRKVQCAKKGG